MYRFVLVCVCVWVCVQLSASLGVRARERRRERERKRDSVLTSIPSQCSHLDTVRRENACVRAEDGRECVFKGILIIVTVEKGNFKVSDGKKGRVDWLGERERGKEEERVID